MSRYPILAMIPLFTLTGLAVGTTPSFDTAVSYPAPSGAYGLAAGDLDNDGAIDLVTTSNTGNPNDPIRIYWNDGSGGFATTSEITSGDGPREIALADFDADGDLDLFISNYFSNDMYLIPNSGGRAFGSPTSYATGGGCQGIDTGDIDNDGDPDFVATDHFGSRIRPYRNINGLGFSSVGLFGTGDNPWAIELADMDNDGDLDSVVTSEESPIVTIAYNAGDGTFPTTIDHTVGRRPTGAAVADLNGDGANDIVTADWGMLSPINNTVSVLLADGDGGFEPAVAYTAYGRPGSVEIADIDSDGTLDLVVACEADDGFAVLTGNGDGTFNAPMLFDIGTQPGRIALADFDGDGDVDIAAAGTVPSRVTVSMNNTGTPVEPRPLDVEWQTSYDNFFNQDTPSHIAVRADGSIVTAGATAFTPNEEDFLIVAFDAQGNQLWEYVYNGDGDHYDKIEHLRVGADGSVIVVGQSWGPSFSVQWATMKLDASGNLLWVDRYEGDNPAASQYPRGMELADDGRIAVGGWSRDASFVNVFFTVVLYDADGGVLFERTLPGTPGIDGQAEDVAFDPDGNIIAIGGIDSAQGFGQDTYLVKLGPTGDVLWSVQGDQAVGDIVESDAAGNIYTAAGGTLTKYNPDGDELWALALGMSRASKITHRPDGTLLVSGASGGGVRIVAVAPDGSVLWATQSPGSVRSDNPEGHLAVQANGTIAVLGQIGTDLGVYRYLPDGSLLDETRVDSGSSTDSRAAIAASGNSLYALGSYEPQIVNRRDFVLFRLDEAELGCNGADIAEPFGVLDLGDVQTFIAGFTGQDPIADIDSNSVFDLADVQAFIGAFTAACP